MKKQIYNLFIPAIFLGAFCLAQKSEAAILYVDQLPAEAGSGWDGIDGHAYVGAPGTGTGYSTIQAAMDAMTQGSTIYMRGGTYNEHQIYMCASRHGLPDNKNKLTSYPGEWAKIDGQHLYDPARIRNAVLYCTGGAGFSNWIFERFEVTGGGDVDELGNPLRSEAGGFYINDNVEGLEFRYLYVHDNYSDTASSGKAGGISLDHARKCTIEYCYLKGNGNPVGQRNSANAQIAITADYAYANPTSLASAMHSNMVRYNLIDGESSDVLGGSSIGFVHKGMQRLTGYDYGETENPADNEPNGAEYREYGDKIHHNIIRNVPGGLRIDQDYCQVYNNVVWLKSMSDYSSTAIQTKDASSSGGRRGSVWPCIYNNTMYGDGEERGVYFSTGLRSSTSTWDCTVDGNSMERAYGMAHNNIISNFVSDYDSSYLSVEQSGLKNCTPPNPVNPSDGHYLLHRNLFYNNPGYNGGSVIRMGNQEYTPAEIDATPASDITWQINEGTLFAGSSGADQYKTIGSFHLDESHTISNGGIGGNHPYLEGVTLPTYVGATNPEDNDWVDGVLSLATVSNLQNAPSGDPSWIEGTVSGDEIAPNAPSGLNVS